MPIEPPPSWCAAAPWPAERPLPSGAAAPEQDPAVLLERDDLEVVVLDAARVPDLGELLSATTGPRPLVLAVGAGAELAPALEAGADAVAHHDSPWSWTLEQTALQARRRRALHALRGRLGVLMGRASLLQLGGLAAGDREEHVDAIIQACRQTRDLLDRFPR